jgi:predicted Zn finger-like uncharacterized protein
MRIACPSCAAEYDVPASRLTPRKMVRCARCGGEWMAVREVEDVAAPAEPPEHEVASPAEIASPLPQITAMDRLAASPAPVPSRASLIGAWVLSVAVLVGAAAATVSYRHEIMGLWPSSGRILAPIDHMMSKPARIAGKTAE